VLYLDASAVVKRYVDEGDDGAAVLDEIVAGARQWGGLVSSEWLVLEVTSALARKVRGSKITEAEFEETLDRFRSDLNAFSLLAVEAGQPARAADLLAAARGLDRFHAGDAIHLHTALQISEALADADRIVLITTDEGFKVVARHHGVAVLDPRTERLDDLARLFGQN
jgi:predicted nucleic acid-binding protein